MIKLRLALPLGLIALAAAGLGLAAAPPATGGASAAGATVVELFTSQGCSSCPPANAAIAQLADRPDLVVLSFGVTYWDQLGWKDSFASPQFTQRQWDYAHGLGHGNVATPQVVVDGRADTPGQSTRVIEPLITAAKAKRPGATHLTRSGDNLMIATGPSRQAATVWLVRYDPRVVQVPVRAGENSGKTLPHRDVVKSLVKLGSWTGPAKTFPIAAGNDPNLKLAVLVQAGTGGPIIDAARL
ncbi:MAG: hypothetical protein JWM33_3405 [Caulobacteraceae bacterium]|nr:hypothetical protein [Caulobacteraceae bacterium]